MRVTAGVDELDTGALDRDEATEEGTEDGADDEVEIGLDDEDVVEGSEEERTELLVLTLDCAEDAESLQRLPTSTGVSVAPPFLST